MEALLTSTPETYKQLLKRSLLLYRYGFKKIFLLGFILSTVIFIPRLISILINQDLYQSIAIYSPYRLWLTFIDVVGLVFFIAILWRFHCLLVGIREPIKQDVRMGLKKVFYVFIASIIQNCFIYTMLFIIIGMQMVIEPSTLGPIYAGFLFIGQVFLFLYVMTLFIFYLPLIATENYHVLKALGHSVTLVWNHWWRVFSLQITPWFSYFLVLVLLKNITGVNFHIYFMEYQQHGLWPSIINLGLFALFAPWAAAVLLVQLNDLHLRKKIG